MKKVIQATVQPIVLTSTRLMIRQLRHADILPMVDFLILNKDFHLPYQVARSDDYYTQAYWQAELEHQNRMEGHRASPLFFVVSLKEQPAEIIGYLHFSNMVLGAFQACHLGYMLGEIYQGQGIMGEALLAAIQYVFKERNLHRIMANYLPNNRRSAAVLKKLGFVIEGLAKNYLWINGSWQDHVLTSLINEDWVKTSDCCY